MRKDKWDMTVSRKLTDYRYQECRISLAGGVKVKCNYGKQEKTNEMEVENFGGA